MEISKTDFSMLMSLIGRAIAIIKELDPTPKEYNVARQLGNLKKKLERRNKS